MNMAVCPLCSQIVLGLRGQDINLDTFYLTSGVEDKAIFDAGVFGECHIACLVSSSWARLWGVRILQNLFNVRGFTLVYEDVEWLIGRNSRAKFSVLASKNGWFVTLPDDMMSKRTSHKE